MKNTILLIDDDSSLVKYIEKSLKEEFKVISLNINTPNFTKTFEERFALIILDELQEKKIKTLSDNKSPILVLSDKKIENIISDKKYYITKPFSFQLFLNTVSQIIIENDTKSSTLTLDTLSIDTKSGHAYRDGRELILTKKEFTLLSYLLKHKNKAVSRSDLLENVWGMQIDPFSNTIEAHIFSLRKKIDRGHKIKLIHTIPKFGYRVSVEK